MPFHGAGNPQAVDGEIPACVDRNPCVLCRNVLDKAFTAFFAAIKNQALGKPLLEPLFLRKALFA